MHLEGPIQYLDCPNESVGPGPRGPSYTSTVLRRHILHRVVAAVVVQEGEVFFERRGPTAWAVADLVPAALLGETALHHVLHGDVVVVPLRRALAAAVAQHDGLVALVAQTEFAHRQLQLPQGARPGPPGSFSPTGLLPLPPLPVQQRPDHVLQLALREALEHGGD